MKSILSITLLVFASLTVFGQGPKVPSKVQQTFKTKFAKAQDVEWGQDDDNKNYVANFYYNDQEQTASFDKNGAWLYTATTLEEEDLPAKIADKIGEHYLGSEITSIQLQTNAKNQKVYLVQLQPEEVYMNDEDEEYDDDNDSNSNPSAFVIKFDENGKILDKKEIF